MNKKRNNKRALLISCLSLVLCLSMLVGTTFAWFTDTATTSVNSIQSGTLDVTLEMSKDGGKTWENAEGEPLDFLYKDNRLWEPGATYELPMLRITNNGSLKLKYKVGITGINGSAKLNEVITWKIDYGNENVDNEKGEYAMNPGGHAIVTISGTMLTSAGNDYQNETIDGISVTVYATQLGGSIGAITGESDSFNNTYDTSAGYPMVIVPPLADQAMTPKKDADDKIIGYTYTSSDKKTSASTDAAVGNDAATPGVTVDGDTADGNVTISSNQDAVAYDISISNLKKNENGEILNAAGEVTTATLNFTISENLDNVAIYHDGAAMTMVNSAEEVNANNEAYYNAANGVVTICVNHFSNFTIVYSTPVAYIDETKVNYTSVQKAVDAAVAGETVVMSADVDERIVVGKQLTLNMNGRTIANSKGIWNDANRIWSLISVAEGGNLTITGNGKVKALEDDCYAVDVKGGAVTIENGTYVGNVSAVYVRTGTANIKGGEYSIQQLAADGTYNLTINCYDDDYKAGTAKIEISGGSFYKFNPQDNASEGEGTNYVVTNYEAEAAGDNYIVKKSLVQEDEEGDKTATVGTAEDLKKVLNAALKNGKDGDFVITLEQDFDAFGNWTTFGVPNTATNIVIDGAGHTIRNLNNPLMTGLWGGYGTLTFKNLTIDHADISGYDANNVGGSMSAAGAFMAYADHATNVVFENCHLTNSTVSSKAEYVGGLVGYSSADNTSFTGCSVTGSNISGFKSTGAVIGHVAGATEVSDATITDNTITGNTTGRQWGVGAIFGRSNENCSTNVISANLSGNKITQPGATSEQTSEYYGTSYGPTTLPQ